MQIKGMKTTIAFMAGSCGSVLFAHGRHGVDNRQDGGCLNEIL